MTVIEKIDFLMKADGLNKNMLSREIGVPKQNVYNWYNRGCENMALSSFMKLCDFFGVTMDSMAYDDKEIVYLKDIKENSSFEDSIIKAYRSRSPEVQDVILGALGLERPEERKKEA